jgi:hypothetical protein
MSVARLQHYVPQFLLRRFTDKAGALVVFDKAQGRAFKTGTRAVAAEAFFYDVDLGEEVLTLEPGLAQLEADAARVINDIHEVQSLRGMTAFDRGVLALFIAVQALRTQHQRANIVHMSSLLAERVNRLVPDDRPDTRMAGLTEREAKVMSLALVTDGAKEIAHILAAKPWILARAPGANLCLGDNPVAMHNERDFGVYGSIGFAVAGVEVHFPIGPTLTLFSPCPTTIEVVDDRGWLRIAKVLP